MIGDPTAGERSVVPSSETFAAIPVVAPRRVHPLRRAALIGGSVLAHLAALELILWTQPPASPFIDPPAIVVALMPPPPKQPPPKPPPKPQPTPVKDSKAPAPAKGPPEKSPSPAKAAAPSHVRPTPAPPQPNSVAVAFRAPPPREAFTELSAGDAAGAQGAGDEAGGGAGGGGPGGGGNGGGCDMVRRLQNALSRDSRVKAAVSGALGDRLSTGRGMVVWNGDWVASHGEDGKGLAALRQAIAWEVGFAPKACREQAVRGYVLVKLTDNTRIALGAPSWRWSDLLGLRR